MSLADLRKQSSEKFLNSVISKSKSIEKPKTTVTKGATLFDQINNLSDLVRQKLGHYADELECITDYDYFVGYITTAIENGAIAIDTETMGLDPISDGIVGVCIYTPTRKAAYVPINHISLVTNQRHSNQLTESQVATQFNRLKESKTDIIYFNAKFDIRVMRHQLGVDLEPAWDGFVASKVLKENEEEANLKYLWKKYCSPNKDEPHLTFDKLFKGYTFNVFPISTAYLYAAKDALMTWELYEFQKPYLTKTDQKCIDCDFTRLAYVYHEIELPIISVVADIEDTGIALDSDYCAVLSTKYHDIEQEKLHKFYTLLDEYQEKINEYKLNNPKSKIGSPLNIASPVQLAELFYDILQIPSVSKKDPRGTGEDILKMIDQKYDNPLCKAILEYRGVGKLLSTYIDKLPEIRNKRTGKVHCSFNQMGTDTGRFSSSSPNLQNIPSHNKHIRPMFIPSEGCIFIGSDYSQQEPKITADLSGDEKFISDCASGKDAYATLASIAFNMPYDECLEFRPDGSVNKEGKERRGIAKVLVLGICYGKSMESIAEDLNVSTEKAKEIYNSVLNAIPGLRHFMEESEEQARTLGYVETKWGRRRHIPDMQLPLYDIKNVSNKNFDPFFDSAELGVVDDIGRLTQKYLQELLNARYYKQKIQIKERAEKDGFKVKDNTKAIDEAKRQCVNSRVQGSAADQTKIAIQNIKNSKRLKELGFKIVLLVHDEIIGECPIENAVEARDIFVQCMLDAAKDLRSGAKCDASISARWYGKELDIDNLTIDEIKEEIEKENQECLKV